MRHLQDPLYVSLSNTLLFNKHWSAIWPKAKLRRRKNKWELFTLCFEEELSKTLNYA